MFTPDIKDWVTALAPTVSVLVAIIALGVSLWVANAQRQIQERQLKQNLFDKRYAVFLAVEEFLIHVLKTDGSVKLTGDEFRHFRFAAEQAEFLFGADVNNYMKDVNQAVLDLHPKCFTRDHLVSMNQQDAALSVEIVQVLGEISGPLLEKRKKVFGPYLQASRSMTAEGSVAAMKLNGWQRLSVVAVVMWMLPVLVFSYELWPIASSVSKGEVYMRMKPDEGHRLSDYYDVVAIQLGGTNLMNPLIVRLQQDKDFLAASTKDQKAYLSTIDPDFAKASPLDQNAYLANITGLVGPSASIDGRTVQFVPGVSLDDQGKSVRAYHVALRRILALERVSFIGKAFGSWIVPICALYALGWALGWVRRGFSGNSLDRTERT